MTQPSLACCLSPQDRVWQLGELARIPGQVFLIGWNSTDSADALAPPLKVRHVIAEALTRVATVAYLSTHKPAALVDSTVWKPFGVGLRRWIGRLTLGVGRSAGLCFAKQPDEMLPAFDDPGFPWTMQGQVMLLVSPGGALAAVEPSSILPLMEDGWIDMAANLQRQGVMAVARPGVDGAVMGVFCMNPQVREALLAALADAAHRAGVGWALLAEAAFKEHLASGGETKRGG